jgi:tRNA-binding EMAP/Myf-like protein
MAGGMEVERLGLVVGRVVAVDDHPGSRAPSYRLTLDLGPSGRRQATLPAGLYSRDDLLDRRVVCTLEGEEAVVVAARSHAKGLVLLVPERDVEDGTAVA